MKTSKIDTSWTLCEGTKEEIKALSEFLKVEIPGAQFDRLVKIGVKSKYKSFVRLSKANPEQCVIYSGLLEILGTFGLTAYEKKTDWSSEEVQAYIDSVELPFEPRDYQKRNVLLALTKGVMLFKAATSSGKSLTISLILEFFRRKSLKGVLIVPNINLLTQFKSDIELYGLKELADQVEINGAGNKSSFEKTVTITTWQSMMEHRFSMKELGLDFLICDESHRMASDITSSIIANSTTTKIKLGFTGTIPKDPIAKMELLGLFGKPETIITARQLIDMGLGTELIIKPVILNYRPEDKTKFHDVQGYPDQMNFLKENKERSETIVKIAKSQSQKGKNVLVLFSHIAYGKTLFEKTCPETLEKDKDGLPIIPDFDNQIRLNLFYSSGETKTKIREAIRNKIEEVSGGIYFANYALLSTGVNIKKLDVLILAQPLKAFTTVTQSIGRLMRQHKSKDSATVIDIVDNFGIRKPSGVFWKQYQQRLHDSYEPEEYTIQEVQINL